MLHHRRAPAIVAAGTFVLLSGAGALHMAQMPPAPRPAIMLERARAEPMPPSLVYVLDSAPLPPAQKPVPFFKPREPSLWTHPF